MRKIVATIWPASESERHLKEILPFVWIARMNMSHGTHMEHKGKIDLVREIDSEVKILIDLQGPKIRLGKFPDGSVIFNGTDRTHLMYDPERINTCDRMHLYVTYPQVIEELQPDDIVLFNDGYLTAKVIEKREDGRLIIEMLHRGVLSSNKWVNTSTASLSVSPLTEKDIIDLEFGLSLNPEYVALSFVRSAADIVDLRKRIEAYGSKNVKIVAKIERHEALGRLDEICQEADVIMIARGDLGIEIDPVLMPEVQIQILEAAKKYGKEVVWATQVLEAMINSPRASRAEITDLYTAIKAGSDYTMLSAETASGSFPIKAVEFMNAMWERYGK